VQPRLRRSSIRSRIGAFSLETGACLNSAPDAGGRRGGNDLSGSCHRRLTPSSESGQYRACRAECE
jgi:hypothetical protein